MWSLKYPRADNRYGPFQRGALRRSNIDSYKKEKKMANTIGRNRSQYLRMEIKEVLDKCGRIVSFDIDDCYKMVDELPDHDNVKELDNMIDLHNQIGKFINLLFFFN